MARQDIRLRSDSDDLTLTKQATERQDIILRAKVVNNGDIALGFPAVSPAEAAAGGAISGDGVTAQAIQSTVGAALLEFRITGSTAQAASTTSGAATLAFRIVGATAQAAQATAGAAREAFSATGTTAQTVQVTVGAAIETFRVAGSTAQAAQATAGLATVLSPRTIVGTTAQALQSTSGSAAIEEASRSGAGRLLDYAYVGDRLGGKWVRAFRGRAATTGPTQATRGEASVLVVAQGSTVSPSNRAYGAASLRFEGSGSSIAPSNRGSGSVDTRWVDSDEELELLGLIDEDLLIAA